MEGASSEEGALRALLPKPAPSSCVTDSDYFMVLSKDRSCSVMPQGQVSWFAQEAAPPRATSPATLSQTSQKRVNDSEQTKCSPLVYFQLTLRPDEDTGRTEQLLLAKRKLRTSQRVFLSCFFGFAFLLQRGTISVL